MISALFIWLGGVLLGYGLRGLIDTIIEHKKEIERCENDNTL